MSRKRKRELQQEDSDLYSDYYGDLPDDIEGFEDLAADIYSTEWENPAGTRRNARMKRKARSRDDFKEYYSDFGDRSDFDC